LQIVFHIGPHKTGTTSIQSYLLGKIGSADPVEVWYPYLKCSQPGHAKLASDWMKQDAQMLRDLIARAVSADVKQLIISAEDFDYLYNDKQQVLTDILAPFDVHLVLTMNSLVRRAGSTWQEAVKHGHEGLLEEATAFVLDTPGFRPDFVNVVLRVLSPARTTIIVASPGQPPAKLIGDFCEAIGQPPPPAADEIPVANVRLFKNEADLIQIMNKTLNKLELSALDKSAVRMAAVHGLVLTRVKGIDYPTIVTPDHMNEAAKTAALEMIDAIGHLCATEKVTVVGDLNSLASD
jgi:hypothetical protein